MKMRCSNERCLPVLLLVSALSFLSSCFSTGPLTEGSVHSRYHISDQTPLPSFCVYQYRTDSLRLYFTLPVPQSPAEGGKPGDTLRYRMFARVVAETDQRAVTDSITSVYLAPMDGTQGELTGEATLFTGDPAGKTLAVTFTEVGAGADSHHSFNLIPFYPAARYHYMLTDGQSQPFTGHVTTGTSVKIRSSIIGTQLIRARYYRDVFPIAMPPYASLPKQWFSYEADSVFDIAFTDGSTDLLRFPQPGLYHLTADTSSQEGFTMYVRAGSFPWITQSSQMVAPLNYITTEKEYRAMEESLDAKGAVDQFWISVAGNELRARKLIREYYRRVEKANYLFTSYQDGWKTDRGMIYIMYGPPTLVQRTAATEVWTYGESRHLLSLSFVFIRMKNPFTENDYLLERNPSYKAGWYQMVNSWRR